MDTHDEKHRFLAMTSVMLAATANMKRKRGGWEETRRKGNRQQKREWKTRGDQGGGSVEVAMPAGFVMDVVVELHNRSPLADHSTCRGLRTQ